jgi:O-antigen ligase
MSRGSAGTSVAAGNKTPLKHTKLVIRTDTPKWMIRYAYYAFIFSLPFEAVDIGITATLSRLFGLGLATVALLQPKLCFKFPPKAFWWFATYLFAYLLSGAYLVLTEERVPGLAGSILFSLLTLIQLLILFWISYNLLHHERIIKGTLWALAAGTIVLAILQLLGVTTNLTGHSRVTAFDQNPNSLASGLALGLLALVGLAFGRKNRDWKAFLLFWLASGIIAIAIVQTGGRGAMLALVGSLSVLFLKGKSLPAKIRLGLIGIVGIATLAFASYQIDAVRKRWEMAIYEGSMSGREKIFPAALEMILEKPLTGWGPVNHTWELGSRLGEPNRDEHNLYLRLLAEVGLLGAIPFFAGLWLCCLAAWRARHGIQGALPMIFMFFVLVMGLSGGPLFRKLFWVLLAYALASSSYVGVRKIWKAVAVSRYPASPAKEHVMRFKPSNTSTHPARKV